MPRRKESRPEFKILSVQVPAQTAEDLVKLAEANDRTLSHEMRRALRLHLNRESGRKAA